MALNTVKVDILTLTNLAWELYHSCYLVARDAPDGFRQLVNELASLQDVLRALRDDVNSSQWFLEDLGENRRNALQRCLSGCFQTLQRLRELMKRYQDMGINDGGHFWHEINWATQQVQIDELKSNIVMYARDIRLCINSTEDSFLARTQAQTTNALQTEHYDYPASSLTVTIPGPTSMEESGIKPYGAPPVRKHGRLSNSSESTTSGRSGLYEIRGSISESIAERKMTPTGQRESVPFTNVSFAPAKSQHDLQPNSGGYIEDIDPQMADSSPMEVKYAVAGAMQELHRFKIRDRLSRTLRYEPRDKFHRPDAELTMKFNELAMDGLESMRLSTSDWLKVAIWWLLKSRTTLAHSDKAVLASPQKSPSVVSSSTSNQAYVDLLKASFILYDIVLAEGGPQEPLTDEDRKLISDSSEGLKDDFAQFSSVDVPEYTTIHSQNLDIWEALQPEERPENGDSRGLDNGRWITVESEDAGDEEERVLCRTFVNAGIGDKKLRMRTKGAPYMLLLTTQEGESEPKITICNQRGTLCLQRDFDQNDLRSLATVYEASLSGYPGTRISDPVLLMFDSRKITVSFQHASDLMQFITIPRRYFQAVSLREPVDCDMFSENLIFRGSVEVFERLKASTMKPTNPPMISRSCEIRILERSFGEAWRSTRRMVISTSVAESSPTSIEIFMPMSRVQVSQEDDSCQVLVKWSDVRQERSTTDGSYNPLYSYVYDGNSPNVGLRLRFRSKDQAKEFEKAVLSLSLKPIFSWTQANSSGRVYDVVDVVLDQKQYKAIMVLSKRLSYRYTNLYYLYRDTDYIYESSNTRVCFPRIVYVDYISTHIDKLYHADQPVAFSHCEKKSGTMTVDFNEEHILRAFMSSLSSMHELLFSRRAASLTTKAKKKLLGSNKSSKGETEVELWRTGGAIQLAARWNDDVSDRWLTMTVPAKKIDPPRDSNRVEFPIVEYARGTLLNMAKITAGAPKDPNMLRRAGPITITFSSFKDREEFVGILVGNSVRRTQTHGVRPSWSMAF